MRIKESGADGPKQKLLHSQGDRRSVCKIYASLTYYLLAYLASCSTALVKEMIFLLVLCSQNWWQFQIPCRL